MDDVEDLLQAPEVKPATSTVVLPPFLNFAFYSPQTVDEKEGVCETRYLRERSRDSPDIRFLSPNVHRYPPGCVHPEIGVCMYIERAWEQEDAVEVGCTYARYR